MIAAPAPLSRLGAAGVLLLLACIAGCSDSSSPDSPDEYPLLEEAPAVEMQPPVTTPSGAVVTLPVLPTAYEAEPSPTCERALTESPDGQRTIVIPPAPGLRAVAVTEHTTRVEWSFRDLPDDCRPVRILLAMVNASEPNATPTVEEVEVTGDSGSEEVSYPDFLPAPNVARAVAYSEEGISSRTVSVLIER